MTTTVRWYSLATVVRAVVAAALGIASFHARESSLGGPFVALAFVADLLGLGAALALVSRMQAERAARRVVPMKTTGPFFFGGAACVLDALVSSNATTIGGIGSLVFLLIPLAGIAEVLFLAAIAHEIGRRRPDATPSLRAVLPGLLCGTLVIGTFLCTFALRILSGAGAGHMGLALQARMHHVEEIALGVWVLQAVVHVFTVRRLGAQAS